MGSSRGLHGLADILADELAVRGVSIPHETCVDIIRDRADAVAAGLQIQRSSALRYLGPQTIANIAGTVARQVIVEQVYEELSDPMFNPAHPDAPENGLSLTHGIDDKHDGVWPVLCVTPLGAASPKLLMNLLTAQIITAAFQTCGSGHEGPCDTSPSEHPHMNVHLNAGEDYGHKNCMVLDVCVGCHGADLAAMITTRGAVLQAHVSGGGGRTPRVKVWLPDPVSARANFDVARARLLE